MNDSVSLQTLEEMKHYYQASGSEYDEIINRQGRYDQGPELNACWLAEWDEVVAQLHAFHLTGDVLELAAGTGIWTQQLLRSASTITAVDASAEMLSINQAKVASPRVTYVLADLFCWQSEHVYDALFFGFWLSHIPREQLDAFLRSCWTWLRPGGKMFFVDDTDGPTTAPDQPVRRDRQIETRTLNDGSSFQIVKNFYEATDLVASCVRAGFDITMRQTPTSFLYGFGTRLPSDKIHRRSSMTQGMAEQQALLTRLVEETYAGRKIVLQPISPYAFEDRGIYRVDWEDGTSAVLRAFLADVTVELTGHAAVLDYLHQRAFSAPQVKRTRDGGLLAIYAGWTALLISFLKGEVADFAPDSLELLGSLAGSLHMLSHNVLTEAEQVWLPESRLRPTQPASQAIDTLVQVLPHVPNELRQFCEDSIAVLQRIQQAQQMGLLPEMLLHGDCWPRNAVRTAEGGMALIDWDCAGIGPAILDVGYLLLACHLGKPQLPAMQADEQRIAAVVHGYCQQRKPSAAELSVLEEAVLYDVARRVGLEKSLSALSTGWTEDVWLQKMLARYHVGPEIAAIARRYFEQEIQPDNSQPC